MFDDGKDMGIEMKSNLDLVDGARVSRDRMRAVRLVAAVLVFVAIVAFGSRHPAPSAASNVGSVAYCVTSDGAPAASGLHTALYTVGDTQLELYTTGLTGYHGCGVFNYVPVDEVFFVSAWSEDGAQVGNSNWFQADAMTVAPAIALMSQPAPSSDSMGPFQSQAN
jgi:hypothetical protein